MPNDKPQAIVWTPAVMSALKEMSDAEKREDYENAEIVGSGVEFWLGTRRIHAGTVKRMLRACLVSSDGIGTNYERHTLNEDGRCLVADPNYIPRIYRSNP